MCCFQMKAVRGIAARQLRSLLLASLVFTTCQSTSSGPSAAFVSCQFRNRDGSCENPEQPP